MVGLRFSDINALTLWSPVEQRQWMDGITNASGTKPPLIVDAYTGQVCADNCYFRGYRMQQLTGGDYMIILDEVETLQAIHSMGAITNHTIPFGQRLCDFMTTMQNFLPATMAAIEGLSATFEIDNN